MAKQVLENLTPFGTIRKQLNDNFTELYDRGYVYILDLSISLLSLDQYYELIENIKNDSIIVIKNNGTFDVCTSVVYDDPTIYLEYIDGVENNVLTYIQETITLARGSAIPSHQTSYRYVDESTIILTDNYIKNNFDKVYNSIRQKYGVPVGAYLGMQYKYQFTTNDGFNVIVDLISIAIANNQMEFAYIYNSGKHLINSTIIPVMCTILAIKSSDGTVSINKNNCDLVTG